MKIGCGMLTVGCGVVGVVFVVVGRVTVVGAVVGVPVVPVPVGVDVPLPPLDWLNAGKTNTPNEKAATAVFTQTVRVIRTSGATCLDYPTKPNTGVLTATLPEAPC